MKFCPTNHNGTLLAVLILVIAAVGTCLAGCSAADQANFLSGFVEPPPYVPPETATGSDFAFEWLLGAVLPAAYYPFLHRPLRRWREGRRNR